MRRRDFIRQGLALMIAGPTIGAISQLPGPVRNRFILEVEGLPDVVFTRAEFPIGMSLPDGPPVITAEPVTDEDLHLKRVRFTISQSLKRVQVSREELRDMYARYLVAWPGLVDIL